jgi:hypothetical protein
VRDNLFLVPDVVAGGQNVHSAIQQFLGSFQGNAKATGGIFAIGDYQVYAEFLTEFWNQATYRPAAWLADNVSNHQNTQR